MGAASGKRPARQRPLEEPGPTPPPGFRSAPCSGALGRGLLSAPSHQSHLSIMEEGTGGSVRRHPGETKTGPAPQSREKARLLSRHLYPRIALRPPKARGRRKVNPGPRVSAASPRAIGAELTRARDPSGSEGRDPEKIRGPRLGTASSHPGRGRRGCRPSCHRSWAESDQRAGRERQEAPRRGRTHRAELLGSVLHAPGSGSGAGCSPVSPACAAAAPRLRSASPAPPRPPGPRPSPQSGPAPRPPRPAPAGPGLEPGSGPLASRSHPHTRSPEASQPWNLGPLRSRRLVILPGVGPQSPCSLPHLNPPSIRPLSIPPSGPWIFTPRAPHIARDLLEVRPHLPPSSYCLRTSSIPLQKPSPAQSLQGSSL